MLFLILAINLPLPVLFHQPHEPVLLHYAPLHGHPEYDPALWDPEPVTWNTEVQRRDFAPVPRYRKRAQSNPEIVLREDNPPVPPYREPILLESAPGTVRQPEPKPRKRVQVKLKRDTHHSTGVLRKITYCVLAWNIKLAADWFIPMQIFCL